VIRNRDSSLLVRPLFHQKNAPRPAVNMNTGAQKCVTHRVKNRIGVVVAKSVGDCPSIAPRWMKSRT
jgi:hypothetical protein